jgi:hypothetical protein
MNAWVVRAVALGGVIVVIRLLLEQAMEQWPTHSGPLRPVLLLVVLVAGLTWGYLDGRADRAAHPDPDDGADLTVRWLAAAAAAGPGGGIAAWLIARVPGIGVDMGGNSLLFELTSGAAFVVLIVFLPAVLGVGIARHRLERKAEKAAAAAQSKQTAAA